MSGYEALKPATRWLMEIFDSQSYYLSSVVGMGAAHAQPSISRFRGLKVRRSAVWNSTKFVDRCILKLFIQLWNVRSGSREKSWPSFYFHRQFEKCFLLQKGDEKKKEDIVLTVLLVGTRPRGWKGRERIGGRKAWMEGLSISKLYVL